MSYDQATLAFGIASSTLYLFWAFYQWHTPERHMAVTLTFYAMANMPMLYPVMKRVFFT